MNEMRKRVGDAIASGMARAILQHSDDPERGHDEVARSAIEAVWELIKDDPDMSEATHLTFEAALAGRRMQ